MKTTFRTVIESLRNSGLTVLELNSGKAGQIAFLPEFGRVIGLWTSLDESSLLWYNQDFPESVSKGSSLNTSFWANPGGDRLWLSPERDFFIVDHKDPWGTYAVPRCIDPGDYTYISDGVMVQMHNSGTIRGYESNSDTPFSLNRQFRSLDDSELSMICNITSVDSAGYEEKIDMQLTTGIHTPISFWNLTQVPNGGTVLMGVSDSDPDIVVYLGETDDSIGDSDDGLLPVKFEGTSQYKIGLSAKHSSGFLAYLRDEDVMSTILIRTFQVDSNANYIDVPPDGRPGKPCPVQLFFGGDTYDFGELEYHSPSFSDAENTHSGVSRLYAFRGSKSHLIQILSDFQSALL